MQCNASLRPHKTLVFLLQISCMLRKCNVDIRSICYTGDIRTKARSLQELVRSVDEETGFEVKDLQKE